MEGGPNLNHYLEEQKQEDSHEFNDFPINQGDSGSSDLEMDDGPGGSDIAPEELRKEVYNEMKLHNNAGSRDFLIAMLRQNQVNNSDNDEEACDHISDDMKTRYTAQAIESCQSTEFVLLLLQNFGRGKNSDIIELVAKKINEQVKRKDDLIADLLSKNKSLATKNSKLVNKINSISASYKEEVRKNKALEAKMNQSSVRRIPPPIPQKPSMQSIGTSPQGRLQQHQATMIRPQMQDKCTS